MAFSSYSWKFESWFQNQRIHKTVLFYYNESEDRRYWETCVFTFDLKADLRSLKNWNVKQLFLYISAEFNNATDSQQSENILWDAIIENSKSNFDLTFTKRNLKYALRDVYKKLKGQKVKISVHAEIMPIVGKIWRVILLINYSIDFTKQRFNFLPKTSLHPEESTNSNSFP